MKPTRRELLRAMGLVGAAASVGCVDGGVIDVETREPDPTGPWPGLGEADDSAFPMGVQSGDPLPDRVIVWTRYDGTAPLWLVVAMWDGTEWVEEPAVLVDVAGGLAHFAGGFVHFDLTNRPSDRAIAFQFGDDEGRFSRVGHTRTAFGRDATGSLRIGATSCLSQNHADYPSLDAVVGRGPLDLWLWLGDSAYFDSKHTRPEYDALWHQNLSKNGFRSVLAAMASVYTWDDHEVGDNWTHEPDFPLERIQTAYDAFFANTPIRRHATDPRRIWRSLRYGRTAEIFVLDCRGERDERNGVYVSDEQLGWLVDGLAASTSRWKLVVNSVPFANMPGPYDVQVGLADRWEGYPAQRQALLEAAAAVPGVLFVSGDVHHPALIRAEPEGLGSNILDFLVGPAGSFPNPLGQLLRGNPGYLWGTTTWNSARIDLSSTGWARLVVVGEEDQTWMEAWIDDRGEVLSLEEIDPEEEGEGA